MKTKVFLILASAAILAGCNPGNGVTEPKSLRLSPQQEQMLQVSNDFSFNLLRHVSAQEQAANIVLSPLSASMMLGMVMNGSDGETLRQLQTSLGFGADYSIEDINEYYHQLLDALPALDKTNKVRIANALWAQEGFPFYESFMKVNKEWFSACVENVDFSNSGTVDQINNWASKSTNGLIKKVVSEQDLRSDLVMILANALYFKGIWEEKFSKSDTYKREFTTAGGQTTEVDMMHQTEDFRYADVEDGQLLEMNYKEGQYCMDILLPAKDKSLRQVVAGLTAQKWNSWLGNMRNYEVHVAFPKIEAKYNAELTKALQETGIKDAFNPLTADFSKMSDKPLYLSVVKQFCYMKVDEEGTEAAAVTVGMMNKATAAMEEYREFIVDRPYLMVIREKRFGTILFVATVGNPNA